jgi:hypothetical protein
MLGHELIRLKYIEITVKYAVFNRILTCFLPHFFWRPNVSANLGIKERPRSGNLDAFVLFVPPL